MTDDELIARLREDDTDFWHCEAADRIEALVRELATSNEIGRAFEEDAGQQRARAERLEAALRLLHDNVVLAFPTLADLGPVANARKALKGADHE